MGQEGSVWAFVPVAIGALKVAPADADVRLLLAEAYAKVGLKTAAGEQIRALPTQVIEHPKVIEAARRIAMLPEDGVTVDALNATLKKNLDALALRGSLPADLRQFVAGWRARAEGREHFRSACGKMVWRTMARGGEGVGTWERFGDVAAALEGVQLPFQPTVAGAAGSSYPPPVIVEGAEPPELLSRVLRATMPSGDGYRALITIVQGDPMQLCDGLMQVDLSAMLSDDRVRVCVGASAGKEVRTELMRGVLAGERPVGISMTIPTCQPRVSPSPSEIIGEAERAYSAAFGEPRDRVATAYGVRDRAWWARRFSERSAKPLRVLLVTSRYTTYVRHVVADLGGALERQGCAVRVVEEPTAHATFDRLLCQRVVTEFEPDLVVIANFPRSALGEAMPQNVPFVMWVQDLMPQQQSRAIGEGMGPLDFVMGSVREEMFQQWMYPRARALAAPMSVSSRKFHAGAVGEGGERFACEVAYVSHHAEPTRVLHERKVKEAGATPGLGAVLEAMYPEVVRAAESPVGDGSIGPRLHAIVREALREGRLNADDRSVALITGVYAYPIADRAIRHQALGWAAEICRAHQWRMHLYGRGWESHPTLGEYARGELSHDEQLRRAYQCAGAHLHVSAHTAIHQRVFECALSGGIALCRLIADDLSLLEYQAGAMACRAGAVGREDRSRVQADGYHTHVYGEDVEEVGRYAELCERLGLDRPRCVRFNGIHVERLRSSPHEQVDGLGLALTDVFPEPGEVMFHDAAGLEKRLVKAVEDDAWRRAMCEGVAGRARERATIDALGSRMLEFVGKCLADGDASDGRRWYDGVPLAERAKRASKMERG
ncbi:MAG: hypothetical protein K2W85_03635 [Phycisphaerales bacterium]|nr:hypothetical protein [Phycisphaerales bacterium]